jgi:hypothetical protein
LDSSNRADYIWQQNDVGAMDRNSKLL